MSIALQEGLLLAVRNDPARQMIDQALLEPLNVVGSRIGAAPESRADAVDDMAFGDLLRDDLVAHFDGVDGLGCELHMFEIVSRLPPQRRWSGSFRQRLESPWWAMKDHAIVRGPNL